MIFPLNLSRLASRYRTRCLPVPQEPLHLCHLMTDLVFGEVANEAIGICNNLNPKVFLSSVLCTGRRGPISERVEPRVQTWALHHPGHPGPRLIPTLVRELREYRVSLLHTHGFGALLVGAAAARLAGVPTLVHSQYRSPPAQLKRAEPGLLEVARRQVRHWFAGSGHVAGHLEHRLGLPEGTVQVVPRMVNADLFRPAPDRASLRHGMGLEAGELVVTSLGPFFSDKDPGVLLSAAAQLEKGGGPALHLLLAGDGPALDPLRQQAGELGLTDHVTFTGLTGDIPALLAATDVYVQTASDEGTSIATLEAMSCQLPVLLPDRANSCGLVRPGETGLPFIAGDAGALAERLARLAGDPDLQQQLGRNARKQVEEHHATQQVARQYDQVYRRVAGWQVE